MEETVLEQKKLPEEGKTPETPRPKRPLWKRLVRWTLGIIAGLVLLVIVVLVGSFGMLQTQAVQDILRNKANECLAAGDGVRVELTGLSGSIPADVRLAARLSDAHGVWMEIPSLSVGIDLFQPLTKVALKAVVEDALLLRVPDLPPSEPPASEPETPAPTPAQIRSMISSLADATKGIPDWVPAVSVDEIAVRRLRVARSVYAPTPAVQEDGGVQASNAPDKAIPPSIEEGLEITLESHLGVDPSTPGKTGAASGWGDPSIDAKVDLSVATIADVKASPAEEGKSKVQLRDVVKDVRLSKAGTALVLKGSLLSPELTLNVTVDALEASGRMIEGVSVALNVPPTLLGDLAESKEGSIGFATNLSLDGSPIRTALNLVASLADTGISAGVSDLAVDIPGIHLDGGVKATFAPEFPGAGTAPTPEEQIAASAETVSPQETGATSGQAFDRPFELPKIDGGIALKVTDWSIVSKLVPGLSLAGALDARVELMHESSQSAAVSLSCPSLSVVQGGVEAVSLSGLSLGVKASGLSADVKEMMNRAGLNATVALAGAKASGFTVRDFGFTADGILQTGISFALHVAGDAAANLAGTLKTDSLRLSGLSASYPAMKVGVKAIQPLLIAFSGSDVSVQGLALDLTPGGRIRLDGGLSGGRVDATGKVEKLELEAYRAIVPSLPRAGISCDFRVAGPLDAPEGNLVLDVRHLSVKDVPLDPIDVGLRCDIGRDAQGSRALAKILLPPKTLAAIGGKSANIEVRIPLKATDGVINADMAGPLAGTIAYRGGVERLWRLAGQADRKLVGDILLDAKLAGSLQAPGANVSLKFQNGKFTDVGVGLLIDKIALSAGLAVPKGAPATSGTAQFALDCTDGKSGKISFTGKCSLNDLGLNVQGKIQDFAPLRRPDVIAVLSGDLAVSGTATAPVIRGVVSVDKGVLMLERIKTGASGVDTLTIEEGPATRFLGKPKEGKSTAAGGNAPAKDGIGSIDLRFRIPDRFRVVGYNFDSMWGADMRIKGALNNIGLEGAVESKKGTLYLLKRRFTMEKGMVSFAGGFEPVLNIKLVNETTDLVASVNIQGSPRKIDFFLSSEPELKQEEIISRILFNKSKDELSQYELLQLGIAVASLAAGGSSTGSFDKLSQAVGMDMINVGAAEKGGFKVEMGKYVTDKLYIGVEHGPTSNGDKKDTSAVVQYELGANTSANVKSSGTNTSAGFKWKLDY